MSTNLINRTVGATLRTIRDESIPFDDLARCFCGSEAFAAGVVDIVTGGPDWRLLFDPACPATAEEQQAYTRGAVLAELLIDAESRGRERARACQSAMTDADRLGANRLASASEPDAPLPRL
jgi:hypothetical protein